ncbi:hypothetical protein RRG08_059361 [Elysia crispata]|uniref:Uncharacterized protein n=1 Tax=Elysia crispata TaxID=231223 RepID=A0AAE1EEB7_9GAST|nr:hypothetical protein RRG08_059361 [Elysia crispata]
MSRVPTTRSINSKPRVQAYCTTSPPASRRTLSLWVPCWLNNQAHHWSRGGYLGTPQRGDFVLLASELFADHQDKMQVSPPSPSHVSTFPRRGFDRVYVFAFLFFPLVCTDDKRTLTSCVSEGIFLMYALYGMFGDLQFHIEFNDVTFRDMIHLEFQRSNTQRVHGQQLRLHSLPVTGYKLLIPWVARKTLVGDMRQKLGNFPPTQLDRVGPPPGPTAKSSSTLNMCERTYLDLILSHSPKSSHALYHLCLPPEPGPSHCKLLYSATLWSDKLINSISSEPRTGSAQILKASVPRLDMF